MSKKFVNSFCFVWNSPNHDCPAACEYPGSPKQSYRQSAHKQNYCPNISKIAACKLLSPDFIASSKLPPVGFVSARMRVWQLPRRLEVSKYSGFWHTLCNTWKQKLKSFQSWRKGKGEFKKRNHLSAPADCKSHTLGPCVFVQMKPVRREVGAKLDQSVRWVLGPSRWTSLEYWWAVAGKSSLFILARVAAVQLMHHQ